MIDTTTAHCPYQHHQPVPWKAGETEPELVGLCRYDLAAPSSHHAAHEPQAATEPEPEQRDLLWPNGGRPLCGTCKLRPVYMAGQCGPCWAGDTPAGAGDEVEAYRG